jgi:glucose-1-phosphate thymidylyltransferase
MNKDVKKLIEIIKNNKKNLNNDLPILVKGKKKIKKNLYFGKEVTVEPNTFFDTNEGIIFIDDNTKIKANSVLRGPLFIGKNCIINSHTHISSSRIGNACKLGGEIENIIMQDYSNKQHYGYIGYSYIGNWVNIGGGTSIATLKNTYTNIKMAGINTGTQFMGCIIGDYSKTAVNTSIFCGKVIGESSHLYGIITEDVPSFVSYLDKGNMYELPVNLAKRIQERMSLRRGVKFSTENAKKFDQLFKATANDRKKLKVKKGKLKFK